MENIDSSKETPKDLNLSTDIVEEKTEEEPELYDSLSNARKRAHEESIQNDSIEKSHSSGLSDGEEETRNIEGVPPALKLAKTEEAPLIINPVVPVVRPRRRRSPINWSMFELGSDESSSSISSFHISDLSSDDTYYENFLIRTGQARPPPPPPPPPRELEFEVEPSSPIIENPIEDIFSSSSSEDKGADGSEGGILSSPPSSPNENNFADSEWGSEESFMSRESGLSSDSELSEKDKWNCTKCNVKTNNPYLRYCLRCFRIRRNWLPKRPTSQLKPRPAVPKTSSRKRAQASYTLKSASHSPLHSSGDHNLHNESKEGKESLKSEGETSSSRQNDNEANNLVLSGELLQSALDAPPLSVAKKIEESEEGLCSLCMVRERNAAFVHGKTAHMYSCYPCGDKILKRSGKCPICRKKILRVVKVIMV